MKLDTIQTAPAGGERRPKSDFDTLAKGALVRGATHAGKSLDAFSAEGLRALILKGGLA